MKIEKLTEDGNLKSYMKKAMRRTEVVISYYKDVSTEEELECLGNLQKKEEWLAYFKSLTDFYHGWVDRSGRSSSEDNILLLL